MKKNIGFALIERGCAVGARVEARIGGIMQPGTLVELPFI